MTEKRRILISLNPKAGRRSAVRRAEELRDRLTARGYTAELLTDLDEVEEKAKVSFGAGELRALVGVGGDGTAAELTRRTPAGVPITLLPAGTANLIAKEFHLPFDPAQAAAVIDAGRTVTLDAATAGGRLFLIMLTAGIDAEIVAQVHRNREEKFRSGTGNQGHIGYRSYLGPVLRSIRRYPYPAIQVVSAETDPGTEPLSVRWAFLFNIPRYGFGAATVTGSDPQDALLDFCGFRCGGLFPSLFGIALASLGKSHRFFPGFSFRKNTGFRLTPQEADTQIPYQIDGDPVGFLPVDIQIVPNRLTLLVGEKVAAGYR